MVQSRVFFFLQVEADFLENVKQGSYEGALACISGILSGTGVTWRAIQVLKMSNSFYNQETISNSNDELAISFDRNGSYTLYIWNYFLY